MDPDADISVHSGQTSSTNPDGFERLRRVFAYAFAKHEPGAVVRIIDYLCCGGCIVYFAPYQ